MTTTKRPTITTVNYRARDIRPGDIILTTPHMHTRGGPAVWAQVTDIIETGSEANAAANDNRRRYKTGEHSNIALSNFIANTGRQERLGTGLVRLIRVEVTGRFEDDENWFEFRNLDLVNAQVEVR